MPVSLAREKCALAVAAADVGFRVFPVKANSKLPAVKDWPNEATTDRDRIESWWRSNPDFNIGVATGDGTMVLDVDTKNGRDGIGSLDYLDALGLPTSYRVRTPSGGLHVYLRTDTAHSNRANTIEGLSGLDLRGEHGYVLGAGSTIDGVAYAPDGGAPQDLADAPAWFLDILNQRSKHAARGDQPLTELDQPQNIARGVDWLRHHAPEAIQGAGGDTTTYSVAAEMRAFGLSEATALDVMLEHWNEAKASPPWMPDELAVKVANAYRHGQGAPGYKTAAGEFGALDIDIGEPPASVLALSQRKLEEAQDRVRLDRRRRLLSYDDMAAMPEPEWLVEGVIQKRSAALLFGKSNTFKSFLAIDLACSVTTARPWHGRAICAGRVLVVATEGANGVGRLRVPGWFNHYSVDTADRRNIHLLPAEISLDNPADVRWLIGAMSDIGPFALVVLDIFGGTMSGSDIEDTTARLWVRAVQRIIAETGAAVLTVAHTGWHDETRARMHTHFWGSFDSRLRIEGDKDKLTTCMHVERHKDADSTGSWGFSLVPSCGTLIPRFDADVRPMKNAKWTEPERKAFAALDEVLASAGAVQTGAQWPDCKVVAVAAWRQACETAGLTSTDSADARRMAFNRAREKLELRGDVKVQEDFVWSTFDAGAKGGKA